MVMPVPENALADFEVEESILHQLEGPNLHPETKRATVQLREAMTGNDPSVAAVEFTPVAGRAELVSAASHLPTDPDEQALVAATLQFHRERELPNEFREILYVLLKRWLPKTFKAGKKTA